MRLNLNRISRTTGRYRKFQGCYRMFTSTLMFRLRLLLLLHLGPCRRRRKPSINHHSGDLQYAPALVQRLAELRSANHPVLARKRTRKIRRTSVRDRLKGTFSSLVHLPRLIQLSIQPRRFSSSEPSPSPRPSWYYSSTSPTTSYPDLTQTCTRHFNKSRTATAHARICYMLSSQSLKTL